MTEDRAAVVLLGTSFAALGAVVGTLVALSAQSLSQVLFAALFALFGGSLVALLEKLSVGNQVKAAVALLGISLGTAVGLYSGLYVNENQLLTPPSLRRTTPGGDGPRKYLRENILPEADAIDTKYRTGLLPAKDAYEQLRTAIQKKE